METSTTNGAKAARGFGYRAQLLALAAGCAAFPFASLCTPLPASLALAGTALTFLALAHRLAPVGIVAQALRESIDPDEKDDRGDDAARMVADARSLSLRLNQMRHRMAQRHALTGLPTREPFLNRLDAAQRTVESGVLGVIRFMDYDRLAAFDQDKADRALAAFSDRLVGAVSHERPLAHVDRDCFALWYEGALARDLAGSELQALGYVLAQELGEGDLRMGPEVGLGAAVFPDDASEPAALLTRAFAALPKAGQPSGGRIGFFSPAATAAARERFAIEQGLRQAIANEQLLLHFQPVFDTGEGRAIGAEALLRWRHPELGLVPPGKFIPVLEQSGLMEEVGLWVLNAACRQARAWEDQGLVGLKMAVNLSPRQCREPAFASLVTRTLERHGVAPESLELELTETAAMEDADRTRSLLTELRAIGVSVAIDDFGAGYSSLSYLKNLPFNKLKIDREFVERVDERRDSQAICAALVELARGLGITALAEGCERIEEVETLRALGCSMFQGFVFSRPVAAADFAAAVASPVFADFTAPGRLHRRAPRARTIA